MERIPLMEHLQSSHCKLIRCAIEVIDRIKSADAVRITTVPIVIAAAAVANDIASKPTKTNPHSCENELQDRVQRRKEKKRRKIELRKHQQDESVLKTEVVTFCNFSRSSTNSSSLALSPTSSDSTHSLQPKRAIITVKPLIILDVNGILCHRLRQKSKVLPLSPTLGRRTKRVTTCFRPSVGHVAQTDIVPRSDLHQFLTLLNDNFCLAVWTSATRKTAKQLVRLLFPPEIRQNLVFIWHRNFCNLVDGIDQEGSGDNNNPESESNNSYCDESAGNPHKTSHEDLIAIKSLAKVWSSYPIWNATNTLLLDDSPEKCPMKYRKNALHPTPICGTTTDIDGGAYFDNDEENQNRQRCFFEHLANNWSETSSSEYLSSFLKDNAKEYNMGWCMSEA